MQHFDNLDHLPQQDRLLLEAVEQRDLAALQQQLAAGANPSAADDKGLTALHVAAAMAEGPMVDVLLDAGARVSALAQLKHNSLSSMGTMRWGLNHSTVDEKLAPLDYMGQQLGMSNNMTAVLHSAGGVVCQPHLCSGHCVRLAAVVPQLVTAGAPVKVWWWEKQTTPLHYAAEAGCSILVTALLQAGVDPSIINPYGYTVLHAAARSGSWEVVQRLRGALGSSRAARLVRMPGSPSSILPSSTPLNLAVDNGHLEVAEALVAAGANPEEPIGGVGTLLHRALARGHCHLVPLLVTPGSVNMRRSWPNDTALHLAAAYRWQHAQCKQQLVAAAVRAAAALLAAGADPHAKGRHGLTPLETAAAQGHSEVLQVLLEHEVRQRGLKQRQQAGHDQQPLALLQQLGIPALKGGNGPTWRFLLTLAADAGGPGGVRSLWSAMKQQLQTQNLGMAGLYAGMPPPSGPPPRDQATCILDAWVDCWVAACRDLAAQRSKVTSRLEQLVIGPHQQQQQQHLSRSHHNHHQQQQEQQQQLGGPVAAGAPQLACKLQLLQLQQEQLAPAAGTHATITSSTSSSSSSTTAAPVETSHTPPAAGQLEGLGAAAASGSLQGMFAALWQQPDRAEKLVAAVATFAGSLGRWGLCLQLLRALVMRDEAKGRAAVQDVLASASSQNAQQPQRQLQVCDALLADWLDMRQQRPRELKEAVVSAAEAAAGGSSL
jgi:ankyrin repeat protein